MRAIVFSVFILIILSGFSAAYAQSSYYMSIPGIVGESTAQDHNGWLMATGLQAQAPQGRSTPGSIQIVRNVDKASPKLMQISSTGKHIPEVVIEAMRTDSTSKQPYLIIKMTDVVISSYDQIPASGGSLPQERIQLNYSKVEWIYNNQSGPAKGSAGQPAESRSSGVRGR